MPTTTPTPGPSTRSKVGRRLLARKGLDRMKLAGVRGKPWDATPAQLETFAMMTLDPRCELTEAVDWLCGVTKPAVSSSAAARFQRMFRVACDEVLYCRPLNLDQRGPSDCRGARERQARTPKRR